MIVTIDGPAGAGKSTVARRLAERLGFRFLDTGAMYRAVAWAAVRDQLPWDQPAALEALARRTRLELSGERVLVDGVDASAAIRTAAITAVIHYAADHPGVRAHLVELQRLAAQGQNIVTEGRDQGTVVFPEAECKFYLVATPEERARRRVADAARRGEKLEFAEVLSQQRQRDLRDQSRAVGPLRRAEDAMEIVTDGLSPTEVVDRLESLVRERMRSSS